MAKVWEGFFITIDVFHVSDHLEQFGGVSFFLQNYFFVNPSLTYNFRISNIYLLFLTKMYLKNPNASIIDPTNPIFYTILTDLVMHLKVVYMVYNSEIIQLY